MRSLHGSRAAGVVRFGRYSGTAMLRYLLESLVFVGLLTGYIMRRRAIAGRAVFIVPAVAILAVYVCWIVVSGREDLNELGLRTDNFGDAANYTGKFFLPLLTTAILGAVLFGKGTLNTSFWATAFVYPLWGVGQQVMFQSFLHTRLLHLGVDSGSTLIVALLFSLAHLESWVLFVSAAVGGIIAGHVFLATHNVLPLGIAHGIFAAVVYELILGKQPLRSFLQSCRASSSTR